MTTFTADQIELQQHIEAQNAEFTAQCKERGATFWTTTVSDPAHWAEYGITTIAQYERHCLVSSIWDGYKEAHGIRPRWLDMDSMSMDELRALEASTWDDVQEDADATAQREEDEIELMMEHGAPDRETAQRWIEEAA